MSLNRKIGLLQIKGQEFRMTPIPLETVRPFVYGEVILSKTQIDTVREDLVEKYLLDKVLDMIEHSKKQLTGNPNQPKIPLIRLKVDYSGGYSIIKNTHFSKNISHLVANPDNVLLFKKKNIKNESNFEKICENNALEIINSIKMDDLIEEYLKNKDNEQIKLDVLSTKLLRNALNEFVSKDEKDSIETMVDLYLDDMHSKLTPNADFKTLEDEIEQIRLQLENQSNYVNFKIKNMKFTVKLEDESLLPTTDEITSLILDL